VAGHSLWGGRTTTVGLGMASTTPDRPAEATYSHWGWFGHPQGTNLKKKKKNSLAFGGGRTTPNGHGVASAIPGQPTTPKAQTRKKKGCLAGVVGPPPRPWTQK
jgi:hypothetical protein